MSVSAARRLRDTLIAGEMVVAPGVFDGLTARLAELGFAIAIHPLTALASAARVYEQCYAALAGRRR